MSYFTPPPTAGAHRPQNVRFAQPGQTTENPGPSLPSPSPVNAQQHPPNMQNPMFAMMAMMQQMQNFPQNLPQQYAQPQTSTPVPEQNLPMPQASDNSLIAQIVYEQTKRGLTYKAALESLHGHKGIAAYVWKDYFLENKQIIDDLVNNIKAHASSSSYVKPEPQNSSSTVVDNRFRDHDSHEIKRKQSQSRVLQPFEESVSKKGKAREMVPTPVVKVEKEKETSGKSSKKNKVLENEGSSRRTLNSLSSTPAQGLLAIVPAGVPIDPYTGLPAAPPRSPSPPVTAPGQKYTDQDGIFFFKRIAYDLARDPDLAKAGLCDILAEKAPHHSALSWKTYWARKEDVADKMVLLTQLDEEDREEAIRSWKTGKSVTANGASQPRRARAVNYNGNSDIGSSGSGSDSAYSEEDSEDAVGSTDDEELGEAGSPFTIAEIRVLAKYIANRPDWFNGYRKWDSFCTSYTQRTPASWREFYRRRSNDVDALARKYIKRAKKRQAVTAQRGRPSWARRGSSRPSGSSIGDSVSSVKRRYDDSGSREQSEEKRARFEDLYDLLH